MNLPYQSQKLASLRILSHLGPQLLSPLMKPILTSPTTSEESTERRLASPIRGVEAQSEPVPYIRPSEDVDNYQIAEEDSHIDPEMPELIDDSDDEDDTYDPPTIKTPPQRRQLPAALQEIEKPLIGFISYVWKTPTKRRLNYCHTT